MIAKHLSSLLVIGSVLALTLLPTAGAAFASGRVTVSSDDTVVAPTARIRDWSGVYGGLSFSAISGRHTFPGTTRPLEDATGAGAFVGHNWQRGHFVYGGELSYTAFDTPYPPSVNRQRNALELRARVGYATGDMLFYGFVGVARSEFRGLTGWNSQSGYSLGFGMQATIARNVFVGVEAARRDVTFPYYGGAPLDSQIDTISLRLGYQF